MLRIVVLLGCDPAAHYSNQKITPSCFKANGARAARVSKDNAAALFPMFHLGGFSGQIEVPLAALQHYDYSLAQPRSFLRHRGRANDAGNMPGAVRALPDEDREPLAHFVANIN